MSDCKKYARIEYPCLRVIQVVAWLLIGTWSYLYAASPWDLALIVQQEYHCFHCFYGTITVTPCSMMWGWTVWRARLLHSYFRHVLSLCFDWHYFIFFFILGLVVWGWGLRTDRVYSLSTDNFLNNNNIFTIFWKTLYFQSFSFFFK